METDRAERIAAVHRTLASLTAAEQLAPRAARARRSGSAVSMVFSLRLDKQELEALQRQARLRGIKPSVLARNLIRIGLTGGGAGELTNVIDQLEETVTELRALAP